MQKALPLGMISKRKLLLCVAALLVTIFAYTFTNTSSVHAASDASWVGGSIQYKGDEYTGPVTATGKESYKLPAGSQIYSYVDQAPPTKDTETAHFIYFGKGVDVSKATNAKYVEYVFTPPDQYSHPSNQKTISIDNSTYGQGASACNIPGAIGWIACPVSNFLAGMVDYIYSIIVGFLVVQPAQIGQRGDMYIAWNVMRSIANIAFVVVFIIIIYSQLTNFGVSNYGIKKLLPRLLIAAILVNISYYICAAAIDLSNILGYTLQHLFLNIRDGLFNHSGAGDNPELYSWTSLAGFILSGGTAVGALSVGSVVAISAAGGTIAGAFYLLLPILLGLLLSILVALFILAARQALIVLLLIISPLAFIAYLLPGTEKWFDKWQDLFMTMLLFFPAFSSVYGAAQLLGSLIIQNASSINIVILGMAVQLAPLAVAPLLIKLSGGFLGRISGIVHNPGKGLVNRTRDWSKVRAEMHRQRGLGDGAKLSRWNFLRNTARRVDDHEREIKERTSNYSAMSDNRYNSSRRHYNQDLIRRQVEETKEIIEKDLDIKWNTHVEIDPHAIEQDLKLRVLSDEAAIGKLKLENRYEEARMKTFPQFAAETESMVDILNRAHNTSQMLAVEGIRTQAAKHMQQKSLAESLSVDLDADGSNRVAYNRSQDLLKIAGGIDPNGAFNAQADAMSSLLKIEDEGIGKSLQYLNARAIQNGKTLKEYTYNIVDDVNKGIAVHPANIYKASLEQQAKEGQIGIIEDALGSLHVDRGIVADIVARNAGTMKEKGGFHVQDKPMELSIHTLQDNNPGMGEEQLRRLFKENLAAARIKTLAESSAEDITKFKVGYFNTLAENMEEQIDLARAYGARTGNTTLIENNLVSAFKNAYATTTNPDLLAKMSNREKQLADMDDAFTKKNVVIDKTPKQMAFERKTPEDRRLDGQNQG